MNWWAQQRQEWIAETLRVFGFINSKHVQRKFGMSHNNAIRDITEYRLKNPTTIYYNENYKCYMLADDMPKGIIRIRFTQPSKRGKTRK